MIPTALGWEQILSACPDRVLEFGPTRLIAQFTDLRARTLQREGEDMSKNILWIALVGMALTAGVAAAEEDAVTKAQKACQSEIETYCSQVTPGQGRLLACFVAHEDKLSGACSWALYEAAAALEDFVAAINHVASECHDDLIKLCGEVQVGEGRVGVCLLEHEEEVSAGCRQAMADTELELVED